MRVFLTYVLPLVLPTLVYIAWVGYARKRHVGKGGAEDDLPGLRRGPLFWSLVAGFMLMLGGLAAIALLSGDPPDSGEYQSPRLQDGKVVPPHFKKD
jgi:hypothetical protein